MRFLRRLVPVFVVGILVVAWWVAASPSKILPTPDKVIVGMVELAGKGVLIQHVIASLFRVTMGYGLALALAIPLGSAMGWVPAAFRAFKPVIRLLGPLSPIAWILIRLLGLGRGMGCCPAAFRAFNPVIQLLRPISPIAWIPIAILWFGVSDASPTFLIFLSSVFPVVVATTSGVHLVERQYIRSARNFEVNGFRLFRQGIFPAALPQILTATAG